MLSKAKSQGAGKFPHTDWHSCADAYQIQVLQIQIVLQILSMNQVQSVCTVFYIGIFTHVQPFYQYATTDITSHCCVTRKSSWPAAIIIFPRKFVKRLRSHHPHLQNLPGQLHTAGRRIFASAERSFARRSALATRPKARPRFAEHPTV